MNWWHNALLSIILFFIGFGITYPIYTGKLEFGQIETGVATHISFDIRGLYAQNIASQYIAQPIQLVDVFSAFMALLMLFLGFILLLLDPATEPVITDYDRPPPSLGIVCSCSLGIVCSGGAS